MKYASAVIAYTAILSAAGALAAPYSVVTERSFNDMDLEARAPETGKPDNKPAPRPPVQEDPRLQFTGGRIPGERKKPVKQQGTTVKDKRSIYDLYLEARGNVLSKPVQEKPPVKIANKRSVDDVYLDARGNVLSKPVKEEKPVKTNRRSFGDFNVEARGNVLSKPVRESTPVKTDKRSMDDFYLNARGNVLSKPVKPPVKTTKRSIDDIYLEARSPETGRAIPKPRPQPIVPKPEDDPRLQFIGGKIPGERVKTRSLNDLDLENRQYIENLAEMFERALQEREFIGFDDLD